MTKYQKEILDTLTRGLSIQRRKLANAASILDRLGCLNTREYQAVDDAYVSLIETGLAPAGLVQVVDRD